MKHLLAIDMNGTPMCTLEYEGDPWEAECAMAHLLHDQYNCPSFEDAGQMFDVEVEECTTK